MLKNIKLGIIKNLLFIIFIYSQSIAEDKISATPIINLENLQPTFEEINNNESISEQNSTFLKEKKIEKAPGNSIIKLNGLDKITAKKKELKLKIGEKKVFGSLEIQILNCGYVDSYKNKQLAAYMQVKDLSNLSEDRVFIFNGWTFSLDRNINPFDHAIYDVWLVDCANV